MPQPRTTGSALHPTGGTFEDQARPVLRRLRRSFGDVLADLPGRQTRASHLARVLGIDPKLAWKVWKLVQLPDPFQAARYAPGAAGIGLFLEAAARAGAGPDLVGQARQAAADLAALIELHAGDRRTFEMLLAGLAEEDPEGLSLQHRKAAFDANSYLFGIQARTQLKTYLLHPSADGRDLDLVVIAGFLDLRCIRPDTAWPVSRLYRLDDEGQVHGLASEPLDPQAAAGGLDLPVLTEHSSGASDGLRPVEGRRGMIGYQRVLGTVGRTGAVDFLTGELARGTMPAWRRGASRTCVVHTRLRTPCETVSLDLFVHRDLFPDGPEPQLYRGMFQGEVLEPLVDEDRLPLPEALEDLGAGLSDVRSPEMPRYPEVLDLACRRAGWHGEDFRGWRISIRYPANPSILALHSGLPEGPP